MKKAKALAAVAVLSTAATVGSSYAWESPVDFYVKYSPYHFKWTEERDGKKLLDENGWVNSVEIGAKIKHFVFLEPKISIYGGGVDYKGQTAGGIPVNSGTNYSGYKLGIDIGKDFNADGHVLAPHISLSPYINVGYERWNRSIDSRIIALEPSPTLSPGYTEKWSRYFAGTGIKAGYDFGSYYIFGHANLNYSLNTQNKVDLAEATIKPKKDINYYVEVGMGVKNLLNKANLEFSVFYSVDRFKQSDPVYSEVVNDYVFQPKSKREVIGVGATLRF